MLLKQVMKDPICQPVERRYKKWYEFMEQNIQFWLKDSVKHTKEHCARVLLLSLVIAYQIGLSYEEMDALSMAAIFHDSRRLDDWLDKGHGKRAAEYYADYCCEHDMPFDEQTYYIMYYHDQDDTIGLSEIAKAPIVSERCMLLYKIFKDADGLDRFRLGPGGLDVNMLRTEEAHKLVDFAKYFLQKSNE
ncbi:HD domain-containing protein [Clostridium sp. A1-XYC3]|uniref:HD domain-containing protein n=1 Tax=Clostridium tanneri TaxID=3037988 RepID=A0ABU4JW40_9CLOT|nr:HD domain-containing protein [Clostridium sp. A1-XYC3]MDW8802369.1 HD domain-containing protein [Clostridium sp. A1-XYC3]